MRLAVDDSVCAQKQQHHVIVGEQPSVAGAARTNTLQLAVQHRFPVAVTPFHRTAEADVAVSFESRFKPSQILGSQGVRIQRATVVRHGEPPRVPVAGETTNTRQIPSLAQNCNGIGGQLDAVHGRLFQTPLLPLSPIAVRTRGSGRCRLAPPCARDGSPGGRCLPRSDDEFTENYSKTWKRRLPLLYRTILTAVVAVAAEHT